MAENPQIKAQGENELVSVKQAAGLLKVSIQTIRRYIHLGLLPAVSVASGKLRPLYRIRAADLQRVLTRYKVHNPEDDVTPGAAAPKPAGVIIKDFKMKPLSKNN